MHAPRPIEDPNARTAAALWPGTNPAAVAGALSAGEVHVWWMDLDVPHRELERIESWLDAGEKARAARFRGDTHRRRFIAAHGQMRALLGAYLGMAPAAVGFMPDALGKPKLAEVHPPAGSPARIEFNLSHSAGEGLLAITSGVTVGADVEVQHALRDLDDLAGRHFTAGELSDLQRLPPTRREDAFFAGWTRKEAYVKALGAGLTVPLDSFDVALHPDEPAALRAIDNDPQAARAWTLWAARPTATSWAAVATPYASAIVRAFALPLAAGGVHGRQPMP